MNCDTQINKVKLALLAMQRYSWEQGVAMQAFLELGEKDVVIAMAKEAAYRNMVDGRVAAIGGMESVTDPCSAGEGLIFSYKKTKDEELKNAYQALLKWALETAPRNEDGIVYHLVEAKEFWVDSMYMLPPFLAVAGYYDESIKQINGYWKTLYNSDKKLMSHMWNDEKKILKRPDFWGVGNGWAIAGMARVIDLLPDYMQKEKDELTEKACTLIESVAGYIREDGLAHNVLDDEKSFIEVNLPQMFSYGIYRGINSGWLKKEKWLEIANKCRVAVENKVDDYGLVQDVCGAPHFKSPGVAPEGQAFYILMQSAYKKM